MMLAAGPVAAQGNRALVLPITGRLAMLAGGGIRLSAHAPVNAWVVLLVAMNMPMFDRVLEAVVTTLKSAMKSKCDPNTQLDSVWPVAGSLTLATCAILTSLAVQFKELLWAVLVAERPAARLYSFCKQVFCANAGVARMASASSTKINENVLQQFVRQLIISSWEIRFELWLVSVGNPG